MHGETLMEQSIRRYAMLVGVLAAFGLATLIPGAGWLGADAQGGAAVTIVDFAFQPMAIFVGVGDTVEWTNTGNADHTVDSDTEIFESDIIDPGESFSYTFDDPGIFPYHCDIHPHMRGMVVVTGR